jgi:hypothetical protein
LIYGVDIHTLSVINLSVQILLLFMVLAGAYFARLKKNYLLHCAILRAAVPLQIVMVGVIMLPSMLGYIEHANRPFVLNLELFIHHTLGLIVIGIWVYVNLVLWGLIKIAGRLFNVMRLAFGTWMLTIMLGFHLYVIAVMQK